MLSTCAASPSGSAVRRRGAVHHRGIVLVVALSAVVALGVGCGIGWQDQEISQVTVGEDDRTLTVAWQCHLDSSLTAEETSDEVRLQFRVYAYQGDCAGTEEVTLRQPLGDRTIIDVTTGEAVSPCAPGEDGCR
jgi:hypothetical protein